MRFFHLSDLHIGKQLHSYSLKEEQENALAQIVQRANEYKPDAILICGDIFDKTVPAGEAWEIFDHFLCQLSKTEIPVMIIAGNHDSPKRLSYASSFLKEHNIFISVLPPTDESQHLKKVTLTDRFGPVDFYLLPFLKPSYVSHFLDCEGGNSYESAIKEILKRENIDESRRNVLLSHQFYQAGDWMTKTCDSEQIIVSVGDTDRIDAELIRSFDYAALGHLHSSQRVKFSHIRYCGTMLKYSVSEEFHQKSILLVELKEKGSLPEFTSIPILPIRDVKTMKGTLEEVIREGKANSLDGICHDYVRVILTDEPEPVEPKERLSKVFDHLLEYRIDNKRTRSILTSQELSMDHFTPLEAFSSFYEEIHKIPLTKEQETTIKDVIQKIGEEKE